MPTDLVLPTGLTPSNLHLRDGVSTRFVDADTFNIAQRVREIDPSLHIFELDEDDTHSYVVMEHGDDGIERLVFRVKELDARVLEKLRYLMAMPLHQRLDRLERDEYRADVARKDDEFEELYERMGRPMLTELERCGFVQRPTSYPKTGVAGGKGSKGKQ